MTKMADKAKVDAPGNYRLHKLNAVKNEGKKTVTIPGHVRAS